DNELPRSISLLLPDSHEMTVATGLLVVDIVFGFPWSSGETHVARRSHSGISRLPRKQRLLISRWRRPWMLEHPLLPIHRARPKQQTIVSNEREERVARVLLLGHLRKRLLGLDHVLQRRLPMRHHRHTQHQQQAKNFYFHICVHPRESAAPIAACKTDSGVHSSTDRTSDKYPRLITASRSHIPNNSGK